MSVQMLGPLNCAVPTHQFRTTQRPVRSPMYWLLCTQEGRGFQRLERGRCLTPPRGIGTLGPKFCGIRETWHRDGGSCGRGLGRCPSQEFRVQGGRVSGKSVSVTTTGVTSATVRTRDSGRTGVFWTVTSLVPWVLDLHLS